MSLGLVGSDYTAHIVVCLEWTSSTTRQILCRIF